MYFFYKSKQSEVSVPSQCITPNVYTVFMPSVTVYCYVNKPALFEKKYKALQLTKLII